MYGPYAASASVSGLPDSGGDRAVVRPERDRTPYRGIGAAGDYGGVADDFGPVDRIVARLAFYTRHVNEHSDEWMVRHSTNSDARSPRLYAQRLLLNELVAVAHVAHGYMQHIDPMVCLAAGRLATATARHIGQMYTAIKDLCTLH